MQLSGTMELLALVLTFGVHVVGAAILVWALIDRDDQDATSWRDWWPRDGREPEPPVAPAGPSGTGAATPVLPDAMPSPVRLREPGRISEHKGAPARRPVHPPAPERPVPEREGV